MCLLMNVGEMFSFFVMVVKLVWWVISIKMCKLFSSGKLFMICVLCFISYGD